MARGFHFFQKKLFLAKEFSKGSKELKLERKVEIGIKNYFVENKHFWRIRLR